MSEIVYSEQQMDEKKPAILSSTNTTKSIALEARRQVKKYEVSVKPTRSKKKKEIISKR